MMRDLARCYASYFNRRYSRTGQLWEGRFRSCLVDSSAYVLGCYRYIELNPVRAGIVGSASAYSWSSYAGNSGTRVDPLLTEHVEYMALGPAPAARQRAYEHLIGAEDHAELTAALRESTETGFPLVGEAMKLDLESKGMRTARQRSGPRAESDGELGWDSAQLDLLAD